jgi:hypothetical protein
MLKRSEENERYRLQKNTKGWRRLEIDPEGGQGPMWTVKPVYLYREGQRVMGMLNLIRPVRNVTTALHLTRFRLTSSDSACNSSLRMAGIELQAITRSAALRS